MAKFRFIGSFFAFALLLAIPASAADGQVLINHAKALSGSVTPGDTAGYPVILPVPGSYKLSGNLAPPAGVNGINAASVEVTIDLNGFRIDGVNLADTCIRAQGSGAIIEDMRISENKVSGVLVTSVYARIVNNTITGNTLYGIDCVQSCHIEGNYIAANPNTGIRIDSGTILCNTIRGNNAGIHRTGTGAVGFGNNTILNTSSSVLSGPLIRLHPNACSTTGC